MKIIIGMLIGSAVGFLWYKIVGCPAGGCPITSNPVISSVYGAVMGLLISLGGE